MKVLKDCSFISILDNKIEMHGLMQQMGWEIIRRESPGQPGQRSRLWNPEDVHAVLTQKTVRDKCLNLFKLLRHLISLKKLLMYMILSILCFTYPLLLVLGDKGNPRIIL